jgi:hypothetical protein
MPTMLVTFFDIEDIVYFEFIPQGQTVIQTYDMEMLQLLEAVHRKKPEIWPNDWFPHHDNAPAHKALSVKYLLAQNRLLTWNTHPPPLIWLRMTLAVLKK